MEVVKTTIRTHTTGTVTMTEATKTVTLPDVTGHVKSIAIKPSGTSTEFAISCIKAGIAEYILGAAGVEQAVLAAGVVFTPQKLAVDNDLGALTVTSNTYVDYILDSQDITIIVAAGANAETYIVEIIVEE